MRRLLFLGLLLTLAFFSMVSAANSKKTLVVVDSMQIRNTHSLFFSSLKARGFDLTFVHAYDDSTPLQKFGHYFFDNLILFAPTAEDLAPGMNVGSVIEFIDSGRNVLIAGSSNVSEPIRMIANECGLDFDQSQSAVIDYFSNVGGDPTVVASTNWIDSKVILGNAVLSSAPVIFHGIGHAAPSADISPLIYKALVASVTSYSAEPGRRVVEYPQSTATDTLLVTAIQTRNNARLVFSGSLDLFSNMYLISPVEVGGKKYNQTSNEEFANGITSWCFGGRGLLRAQNLHHQLSDGSVVNPLAYRIKDNIQFSIDLQEWDVNTNQWVPFKADDVQLEFVMIDPYIRTSLSHDKKGHFSTTFQVPDVYGVYKFVLKYDKLGYSFLEMSQQVSVHPFRHNQFERFIMVAYPYYASAFSMMVGFFIFGVVFLYSKPQ